MVYQGELSMGIREEKERQLFEEMKQFDLNFGDQIICGLDEAGRGPLMGGVFAAAVVLDYDKEILGLKDSKKISEKKRFLLEALIKKEAKAWAIGYATEKEVDSLGIQKSNFLAFERAYQELAEKLKVEELKALIDGNYHGIDIPNQEMIIKGDAKSLAISAASILAKTARDRYVIEVCHVKYPEYHFDSNKGYGTAEHIEAIKRHGLTEFHRKSFCRKWSDESSETI